MTVCVHQKLGGVGERLSPMPAAYRSGPNVAWVRAALIAVRSLRGVCNHPPKVAISGVCVDVRLVLGA